MLPPLETCDNACSIPSSRYPTLSSSSVITLFLYFLPLLVTFLSVSFVASNRLFPAVSSLDHARPPRHYPPSDAPFNLRQSHAKNNTESSRRKVVAVTFSTTIALSAVLAELILCEISDLLHPSARSIALKVVLPALIFLLVVAIPLLELHYVIGHWGWSFEVADGKVPKVPWVLQTCGFTLWLAGFWYMGTLHFVERVDASSSGLTKTIREACLKRVGIIGISLMALLSGFAAISALWQTFGLKTKRPVTTSDIARKQAGLDSTNDMLAAKESKLRAFQRKVESTQSESFVTNIVGSIRGNADVQELKTIALEITGLKSMKIGLSSSLNILESRFTAEHRAMSPLGKVLLTPISYSFAVYCLYRIIATSITTLRRFLFTSSTTGSYNASDSDPINRVLSLFAEHVDPSLDRVAWSRQISFLLSGIILFASFNSVLQTFHMLTKLSPRLVYQAQANLALIIAQLCASYIISSALLLRSNLPPEMKSVVSAALGTPLEPDFVDRLFEGWFMVAAASTALGIWVERKFSAGLDYADDWDDYGGMELGQKRL